MYAYIPSHGCDIASAPSALLSVIGEKNTGSFDFQDVANISILGEPSSRQIFRITSGHRLHSVPRIRSGRDKAAAITFLSWYVSGHYGLIQPVRQEDQSLDLQAKGLGSSPSLLGDVCYHGSIVREHQQFCPLRIMAAPVL